MCTQPPARERCCLRSSPRPAATIADRRPQHHPVDEEFLCLTGRFTLEGTHWLKPMTYVYYPAGLVHGFGIDIPDGYQVYLRNSGPLGTERVDSPAQDSLYFIRPGSQGRGEPIVAYCDELIRGAVQSSRQAVIMLRKNNHTKEEAFLVCMQPGGQLRCRLNGSGGYAEILVLQGDIKLGEEKRIGKGNYAFLPGFADLRIASVESTILLLNSCNGELASDIARQVDSLHHAVNSLSAH